MSKLFLIILVIAGFLFFTTAQGKTLIETAKNAISVRDNPDEQRRKDIKYLYTEIEKYKVQKGQYPYSLDELKVYAQKVPKDPMTNELYLYESTTSRFKLSAKMSDGTFLTVTNPF